MFTSQCLKIGEEALGTKQKKKPTDQYKEIKRSAAKNARH